MEDRIFGRTSIFIYNENILKLIFNRNQSEGLIIQEKKYNFKDDEAFVLYAETVHR